MNTNSILPTPYAIDYEAVWFAAGEESDTDKAEYLERLLPGVWCDMYAKMVSHRMNLVRFHSASFEYICDVYSQLELIGEVAFDQRVQDRVVAVFGTSSPPTEEIATIKGRAWMNPPHELEGTERDRGHFMARSIGGGLEVTSFSRTVGSIEAGQVKGRFSDGWSDIAMNTPEPSVSRVLSIRTARVSPDGWSLGASKMTARSG